MPRKTKGSLKKPRSKKERAAAAAVSKQARAKTKLENNAAYAVEMATAVSEMMKFSSEIKGERETSVYYKDFCFGDALPPASATLLDIHTQSLEVFELWHDFKPGYRMMEACVAIQKRKLHFADLQTVHLQGLEQTGYVFLQRINHIQKIKDIKKCLEQAEANLEKVRLSNVAENVSFVPDGPAAGTKEVASARAASIASAASP